MEISDAQWVYVVRKWLFRSVNRYGQNALGKSVERRQREKDVSHADESAHCL